MKSLTIAGQNINVLPLRKSELNGMWLELIADFEIGKIQFNGRHMLIFYQKQGEKYTPLQLKNLSERIEKVRRQPSVFYEMAPKCISNQLGYVFAREHNSFSPDKIIQVRTSILSQVCIHI